MSIRCVALSASLFYAIAVQANGLEFAGRQATVERAGPTEGAAAYNFSVRDPDGTLRRRHVAESPERPRVRTADTYLDGLYAMALEEAAANSVDSVEDGQFDHGAPIACHCFKTGVKWPYVWTRDTSYSTDLGGGLLDPVRARNSLAFKLSGLDAGVVAQGHANERSVAQDTGSGGSWPISSDRVVWLDAAVKLIPLLPTDAALAWENEVFQTAVDTLGQERRHTYDADSGLYRGETSFLDWREQTYPIWTRDDTLAIASSYALSTNVLHYLALRDAATLAARRHDPREAMFKQQAADLAVAIRRHFGQLNNGLYASFLFHDRAPIESYDLLGLALMEEAGLLDDASAQRMLTAYPTSDGGPPVIWPEQETAPIYHNRAVWPFVTAYAVRAAERAHDGPHTIAYARSLIRGAALALSNQENAEFLTLSPHFEDGAYTGPVINSASQLWSVTAMLDLVVRDIFGIASEIDGIHVSPSFPALITGHIPQGASAWTLNGLALEGGHTDVVLHFPAHVADHDWLEAAELRFDGQVVALGALLDAHRPPARIDVLLRVRPTAWHPFEPLHVGDAHALTPSEHARVYAPAPPSIDAVAEDAGKVRIAVAGMAPGLTWELWRDGVRVGRGTQGIARDRLPPHHGAACYTLRVRASDGRGSLPSKERCIGATDGVFELAAVDPAIETHGPAVRAADPARLALWGAPEATLSFNAAIGVTGQQRLTIAFRNDGLINTGVTAGVKAVHIVCADRVKDDTVVLPQLGDAVRRGRSTPVEFSGRAGESCRVTLSDAMNMSYLEHFRHYTASRGGDSGAANTVDLLSFRIEPLEPTPKAPH